MNIKNKITKGGKSNKASSNNTKEKVTKAKATKVKATKAKATKAKATKAKKNNVIVTNEISLNNNDIIKIEETSIVNKSNNKNKSNNQNKKNDNKKNAMQNTNKENNQTNNINITIEKVNVNKLNNTTKIIYNAIKLPKDKYEFYDEFLPTNLKKYFKEPIGLYDPYGNNINPLTGAPYQNHYKNETIPYDSGNAKGLVVPITYMNWAYIWSNLPLFSITGEIINSIRNNVITIIKAGTGVGKSFLAGRICSQAFNFQKKVLMTLPKKLLARETASTTAKTCDVVVGEEVGYYFKGSYEIDKNGKESKIIFTTVGSLIRKLTGDDPLLKEYSSIIIDEAHERSVQTDLLILFLNKALKERKDLKVVFISATLDTDAFRNYFKDYTFNVVDMGESTSFNIVDYYEKERPLDWQKLAVEKIMNILREKKEGDILVFIKSGSDANKMRSYLEPQIKTLNGSENPFLVTLEAGSTSDDQRYATKEFNYKDHPDSSLNRPYTRKIVFSTNVAESSLTVKGAVFVIDCGLALEDLYNPLYNANALLEKFISQSAVKQRRGRVGRTKDGECYHLYSEKELATFPKFPIPSIQKSDLTMDILDIMKIHYIKNFGDVKNLLNDMMSPPEKKFIDSAQLNLYSMEAITSQDNDAVLTELGRAITTFSGLPISLARAVIASYYYHCKYDVIPIVVIIGLLGGRIEGLYLDYKPRTKLSNAEFKKEVEKYKKKQHRFDSKYGDFLTVYNVYTEFRNFMKLPKTYLNGANNTKQQQLEGGAIDNNASNISNNSALSNNASITTEMVTKKTANDAIKWCVENGISTRVFVNKRDRKNWDKVGIETRKIERTLMDIVQPSRLRYKNHKEYRNDGGIASKVTLKNEMIDEKKNANVVAPEDRINLSPDMDDVIVEEINEIKDKNKNKNKKGGFKIHDRFSFVQKAGFTNRPYEVNLFPNVVPFPDKDNNIMMALGHGLYINIAKHINQYKYKACYPIEKVYCKPDPKTTLSLSQKPSFLFYNELFMMREDQKELKLNFVNKFPTVVLDEIKLKYKKYIEDCYKKEKDVKEDFHSHSGKKKGNFKSKSKSKGKFSHKKYHKR